MKKAILLLGLFLLPLSASAQVVGFTSNLYYGLTNNAEVSQLQEFLTAQGVYNGPVSGNFYSLTLAGVKEFQSKENITPVSGYFGPITRQTANTILTMETSQNEQNASTSTPPVDLSKIAPTSPVAPQTAPTPTFGATAPISQPSAPQTAIDCTPTLTVSLDKTSVPVYTDGEPWKDIVHLTALYSVPKDCILDDSTPFTVQTPRPDVTLKGNLSNGSEIKDNVAKIISAYAVNTHDDTFVGNVRTFTVTVGTTTQSVSFTISAKN